MLVVIDTNVLVSGIFWAGPPSDILHAWQRNRFELALTSDILEEYKRVADILAKKFPAVHLTQIIDSIVRNASRLLT